MRKSIVLAASLGLSVSLTSSARAHDIRIPVEKLEEDVRRVEGAIDELRSRPLGGRSDETADPRRLLGLAEIELALGHPDRALRLLWGQLEEPGFQRSPQYVPALLLAAEVLEQGADDFGAMALSRRALKHGGDPEAMAEAGARWIRLARRHDRMQGRVEVYRMLRASGALSAADPDLASQARYEAAFALRFDEDLAQARQVLSEVPADAAFGSRAAYLAGVLFVQQGDLSNAERWFGSVMDWPIPARLDVDGQRQVEREVREYAALSAGRLRYEAGDLAGAYEAYQKVSDDSALAPEACWEMAYLTLEMERVGSSMDHLRCVLDHGAAGSRYVDAALFQAALLAHLDRYSESLDAYDRLHGRFERQHGGFAEAVERIEAPHDFLFDAIERSALDGASVLSPGPATLFADAWTEDVDRAYRVDRGLDQVTGQVSSLASELDGYLELLNRTQVFPEVEFRRNMLQRLLRDIEHLIGHAGDLTGKPFAAGGALRADLAVGQAQQVDGLVSRLRSARQRVQRELQVVDAEQARRRNLARRELDAIRSELQALLQQARALDRQAGPLARAAAADALAEIEAFLADAAMRAEVGGLDTYWLKKQSRTRAIEDLLDQKAELERQADEAMGALK